MEKSTISWSVKQIARAVELGSMTFDNAIQRGHVWDIKKQSLFVDSLIRSYPVPPMYTIKTNIDAPDSCKKGSKVYDCIDGKQRCEAIRAFRHNEFALEGLDDDEEELNGKIYDELTEEQKDAFDSYTLVVYFFTDITDDEVSDMMSRLNNGKPLTGVENARIKCKNLPVIISLAKNSLFTDFMSETAIKGYHNEDVVIKTAMQVYCDTFELSSKNVKSAYESFDLSEDKIKFLNTVFDFVKGTINAIRLISKKAARKVLSKTNLVSIIFLAATSVPVEEMEATGDENKEKFAKFLSEFFIGGEKYLSSYNIYNEACTNGTNHKNNVVTRNDILHTEYATYRNTDAVTAEPTAVAAPEDIAVAVPAPEATTELVPETTAE